MDTESLAGWVGEPFLMHVELGKIREFSRATGSSNPEYLDGPDPVIPPTFLATAALWQGPKHTPWAELPRNVGRMLHGEQEFVFHGEPPRAGTVLTGQARIDKVYQKEGRRGGVMTFAETVIEFRDAAGTLVAESRGTSIETSRPPGEEAER
jgi:N-terminal half of MaoC dehydratase